MEPRAITCPGCGYDLRASSGRGRCPECHRPVLEALLPLARPHRVARAVRRLGNSYLGLLALLAAATTSCLAWTGVAVLAVTTVVRLMSALDLRGRAGTGHLPGVAERIERLWHLLVAEAGLLAVWGAARALYEHGNVVAGWVASIGFGVWLLVSLAGLAVAGQVGQGLARILGIPQVVQLLERQSRLAWAVCIGTAAAGACLVLAVPVSPSAAIAVMILAAPAIGLAVLVAIVVTMMGLAQLADATDRAGSASLEAGVIQAFVDVDDEAA